MKKTIRTAEGKWLEINPETDIWIIKKPRPSSWNTPDYAQGEDLYMKNDASGARQYYVISWTAWSRDIKEAFRTLNEEQKDQFIRDYVKKAGKIGLDPDLSDRIEKYFPGLLKGKK